MKIMQIIKKYPKHPISISSKYENPLIFYLYYTKFDPKRFQQFFKTNTVLNNTSGKNNLDENRIVDTNLYIASLRDYRKSSELSLPGAVYFLTKTEVDNSDISWAATNSAIIKLPSGEPLYYEIHF